MVQGFQTPGSFVPRSTPAHWPIYSGTRRRARNIGNCAVAGFQETLEHFCFGRIFLVGRRPCRCGKLRYVPSTGAGLADQGCMSAAGKSQVQPTVAPCRALASPTAGKLLSCSAAFQCCERVPIRTFHHQKKPNPTSLAALSLDHMLRRSALSLARVAARPYSAMASQTPVEDTIREKVTSQSCFGNAPPDPIPRCIVC